MRVCLIVLLTHTGFDIFIYAQFYSHIVLLYTSTFSFLTHKKSASQTAKVGVCEISGLFEGHLVHELSELEIRIEELFPIIQWRGRDCVPLTKCC